MIPCSQLIIINVLRKSSLKSFSNVRTLMFTMSLKLGSNNAIPTLYLSKRQFKTSVTIHQSKKTSLIQKTYFDSEKKNKETFLAAINKFRERERQLRGHVEFIYSALKYLKEFGVHRDLEVYKSLLNIMPKGTMIPTNVFQQEFYHYPKHQECAVQVLEMMENNGVIPDTEVKDILVTTFGYRGEPVLKYARMMYWMPKFKQACPWPLPSTLPNDPLELAKLALIQMNSVDPASKITVMETKDVKDSIDDTWIVSAMSPTQQELLGRHSKQESLKVEGPFGIILHDQRIGYFILRAEPKPTKPRPKRSETDDVSSIFVWVTEEGTKEERELIKPVSVHEQEDGIILATCATGTSSRDSLLSWIRLLEQSCPALQDIPVLFTQSSPIGDIIVSPGDEKQEQPQQEQHPNDDR